MGLLSHLLKFAKLDQPPPPDFAQAVTGLSIPIIPTTMTDWQAEQIVSDWLGRAADPDEILKKAGKSRAQLRIVEYDDEITQCIHTRREAVIATPWRVEPNETEQSDYLEDQIEPWIDHLIRGIFNANLYGYSVIEVVYNEIDGMVGIQSLAEKPFEWFTPRTDGLLIWNSPTLGSVITDPRKYITTIINQTYLNPFGDALLSRLMWPAFFRSEGWKLWMKFIESFGSPRVLATALGGPQQAQEMAERIFEGLQRGGGVIAIGQGETATLQSPGQDGQQFTRLEDALIRRIQKTILGQTLTSQVGDSGSYAAAKVHNEVRLDRRNADIRAVTKGVQKLLDILCDFNLWERVEFVMADDTGIEQERATRDAMFVEKGVLQLTETYLLDRYDYRPGDFIIPATENQNVTRETETETPQGETGAGEEEEVNSADEMEDDMEDEMEDVEMGNHFNILKMATGKPVFTADQQAIEDIADGVLNNLGNPISEDKIRKAIRNAKSPEDLEIRLAKILEKEDFSVYTQVLERALFAADVLGFSHATRKTQE